MRSLAQMLDPPERGVGHLRDCLIMTDPMHQPRQFA